MCWLGANQVSSIEPKKVLDTTGHLAQTAGHLIRTQRQRQEHLAVNQLFGKVSTKSRQSLNKYLETCPSHPPVILIIPTDIGGQRALEARPTC
ncbi:hypothetical protein BaRGS_00011782 [Batillaria attramentaria]|uniref:Uncharacterized protein n=1 Tax=Batillaria attramentaria TaxID=370345 RepID=A0ABD0LCH3_9CAEN